MAGVGGLEAGQDAQQRRLADAVRAHDPDSIPRADGEVDVDEDGRQAARLAQAVGHDGGEKRGGGQLAMDLRRDASGQEAATEIRRARNKSIGAGRERPHPAPAARAAGARLATRDT